jgi:triacylglycerol lipase
MANAPVIMHRGVYRGTLDDVSHLDLINWTNRLRWYIWELTGHRRKFVCFLTLSWRGPYADRTLSFNAIAFYLDIAGTLSFSFMTPLSLPVM